MSLFLTTINSNDELREMMRKDDEELKNSKERLNKDVFVDFFFLFFFLVFIFHSKTPYFLDAN